MYQRNIRLGDFFFFFGCLEAVTRGVTSQFGPCSQLESMVWKWSSLPYKQLLQQNLLANLELPSLETPANDNSGVFCMCRHDCSVPYSFCIATVIKTSPAHASNRFPPPPPRFPLMPSFLSPFKPSPVLISIYCTLFLLFHHRTEPVGGKKVYFTLKDKIQGTWGTQRRSQSQSISILGPYWFFLSDPYLSRNTCQSCSW